MGAGPVDHHVLKGDRRVSKRSLNFLFGILRQHRSKFLQPVRLVVENFGPVTKTVDVDEAIRVISWGVERKPPTLWRRWYQSQRVVRRSAGRYDIATRDDKLMVIRFLVVKVKNLVVTI